METGLRRETSVGSVLNGQERPLLGESQHCPGPGMAGADSWEKTWGRGNSWCKGSEVGRGLKCLRNRKMTHVATAEWVVGRGGGDESEKACRAKHPAPCTPL